MHISHEHLGKGTPIDVPEPRTVSFPAINSMRCKIRLRKDRPVSVAGPSRMGLRWPGPCWERGHTSDVGPSLRRILAFPLI
jgi:hypothetical protein